MTAREHAVESKPGLAVRDLVDQYLFRRRHVGPTLDESMQALKALVIIMGVLIIVGMGLVAYGIAVKFGRLGENGEDALARATGEAWTEDLRVAIPAGARVADVMLDDERLIVRVTLGDGGAMLLVFDPDTGTRLGAIEFVPQEDAQ